MEALEIILKPKLNEYRSELKASQVQAYINLANNVLTFIYNDCFFFKLELASVFYPEDCHF